MVNVFKEKLSDGHPDLYRNYTEVYSDEELSKIIQYEKDQVNTPFVNAQKSLRFILQSELKNGLIPADAAS